MARTLISGGTIVSATGRTTGDVLIEGESVAAILAPGQAASLGVTADRVIDATGKYVVAVSPLEHNWAIKVTANEVLPDLESLLTAIESGRFARPAAGD